jgi:hypothetical protein
MRDVKLRAWGVISEAPVNLICLVADQLATVILLYSCKYIFINKKSLIYLQYSYNIRLMNLEWI